jgi:glyoxylase-like metal-dependent hydrolase (beta-lactamase superfamily II)
LHAQVAAGLLPAPPVVVDLDVADRQVLPFGGGARVISVPGHTDGSIALHLSEHGVLFTGDVVAEYQGAVIPGVFNLDGDRVVSAFHSLAQLDVDVACFGHGTPLLGSAGTKMRQAADAPD